MNSGPTSAASALLADARRLRVEADRAEAAILARATQWAALHVTDDQALCATWGDSPVPIAGAGAPRWCGSSASRSSARCWDSPPTRAGA